MTVDTTASSSKPTSSSSSSSTTPATTASTSSGVSGGGSSSSGPPSTSSASVQPTTTTTTAASSSPATSSSPSNSASASNTSSSNTGASSGQPTQTINVMRKNRSEVIRTIQEIAKIDEYTINQAIEACQDNEGRYSMDQVLNFLMDEQQPQSTNQRTPTNRAQPGSSSSSSSSSSNNNDDKYHLHKSRGSTNVPANERVNEYAANTYGTSNNFEDDDDDDDVQITNTGTSSSSLTSYSVKNVSNMSEMNLLREENKPAGLRNVGNTCWFNSIVQAFFHLPYFRRLILSFQIDPNDINKLDENSKNVVQFVAELRKLFALMLKSKRRSINPNPTLRCLRNCSKYDADTFNQEDVSEFATILVNLIEESFDILFKLQQSTCSASATTSTATETATTTMTAGTSASASTSINTNLVTAAVALASSITTPTLSSQLSSELSTVNSEIGATSDKQKQQQQQQQPPQSISLLASSSPTKTTPTQLTVLTPTDKSSQATSSNLNNLRKNRKNPIVNLLNGDILITRKNSDEDVTSTLIEIFREVNIQMLNARSLHAGLELEWGETSIDKQITTTSSSSSSTTTTPTNKTNPTTNVIKQQQQQQQQQQQTMNRSFYEQESWIVQLPSVLFICLNRYKFVKATQSSSKIVEPFEFYPFIYLDRYMYSNRDIVKAKRKELLAYNNELKKLEEKLNNIKNYKFENANSNNEYNLNDVLKCALHFATTDYSLNEVFSTIKPIAKTNEIEKQATNDDDRIKENDQLKVVQNCLIGWITQLEEKIAELETSIKEIRKKIDNIFDEDKLKKIKYNLHSVCIHEGNATSGHFWTYIWNTQQLKWYKFNDTEVCQSTWDDLYANAVGGNTQPSSSSSSSSTTTGFTSDSAQSESKQTSSSIDNESVESKLSSKTTTPTTTTSSDRTPSAYFLIYAKADDANLYQETTQIEPDLIKLLNIDQENLENQIHNFRLKQLLRDTLERLKKSNNQLAEANHANEQYNQTCIEHAKAFSDSTFEAFASSFDRILPNRNISDNFVPTISNSGLEDALKHAVEIEINKYNETPKDVLNKLPDLDQRIQHILTYFSCNNVPRELKILALYDVFRIQIFPENNLKLKLIQTLAQIKYNEYVLASLTNVSGNSTSNLNPDIFKVYEKWQADYRDFRSIIAAFINAANYTESERYEEAATFFCVACEYNERITSNTNVKMKGMDHEFLLANRRKCLKLWNTSVIRKFTNSGQALLLAESLSLNLNQQHQQQQQQAPLNQQELTSLIETMISNYLPCFFRLANSTAEDKAMIDEIRQDWLGVLDSNLPELQVFHDFMAKLFEDPYLNHFHSLNVNKTNLLNRYKDTVQTIRKLRSK